MRRSRSNFEVRGESSYFSASTYRAKSSYECFAERKPKAKIDGFLSIAAEYLLILISRGFDLLFLTLEMVTSMHTWKQASEKWLLETKHKKDHRCDNAKLKWINEQWEGKKLSEIKRDLISELADLKLQTVKASTVNRYLALIRAILRRAAHEWEWLEKAPHVRLLHEPRRRIRWLKPNEAKILKEHLREHQKLPMIFAISTGLRASNVVGLKWSQIDLERNVCWFFGEQVKNGEDLSVSLNENAMAVLHACRNIHDEYVFTYKGKPLKRLSTRAWYKALKRAKIENFRWHDLRHTWASWLIQEGVPLYALQEMGGWKTASMVRRYAHLSPAHNLANAKLIDAALSEVSGHESQTIAKKS